MQIFLIIVHVIACLFLIAVILLQAGRGGGLSDIAGGSQAQSILGTETNTFMKRLTEIFAIIFIITSLSLGIISTHRGKSLMEQRGMVRRTALPSPLTAGVPTKPLAAPTPAVSPASPAPVAAAAVPAAKPSAEGNAK